MNYLNTFFFYFAEVELLSLPILLVVRLIHCRYSISLFPLNHPKTLILVLAFNYFIIDDVFKSLTSFSFLSPVLLLVETGYSLALLVRNYYLLLVRNHFTTQVKVISGCSVSMPAQHYSDECTIRFKV